MPGPAPIRPLHRALPNVHFAIIDGAYLAPWVLPDATPPTLTLNGASAVTMEVGQTYTVDFDTVLSGSIELILDDGVHPLKAGDHVMVTGVDHAWCAGPDGCRMSIVSLGVSPPA